MVKAAILRCVLASALLATIVGAATAQTVSGGSDAAATDIVATQIREQGYDCKEPVSAKPDQDASKPDEEAWVLTCKNAAYRVRLVPDMAAEVEQID
jgi:hypothetical protein